jgi:branched-chain amino acid transport system ATP-binding protein
MSLKLTDVNAGYKNKRVLMGVSMEVHPAEIVTLIGANGVGKTTTLRTIIGLLHPWSGQIIYNDDDISRWSPAKNIRHNISLVPEGGRVFAKLTVRENLEMGGYFVDNAQEIKKRINEMYDIFPALRSRESQRAGTLSGGERQMLAIGRSLMTYPKLLILDEPSTGLSPVLVAELFKVLKHLKTSMKTSILLVEQMIRDSLHISDRAYVMRAGKILYHAEKNPENLVQDEALKKAFLT